MKFDVVIIGGGPAGNAAALALLNNSSFKVAIVESTDYSAMRIGESVSPSIMPLLRYLKIDDEFLSMKQIPSQGMDASWGSNNVFSRNFFFTGQGTGWHLDRVLFDKMLGKMAAKRHGTMFEQTKFLRAFKKGEEWTLILEQNTGDKMQLMANFVIDASGRSAVFARNVGMKWQIYDNLIGVAGMYDMGGTEKTQHATLIESSPDGWWYVSPIPENRKVVAFMTDSDIAKSNKISHLENWNDALNKTIHIKNTVKNGSLTSSLRIFPAYSHLMQETVFENWLPAGDAVSSFDPLSSMGIGYSMLLGIHATQVAYHILKSKQDYASSYMHDVIKNFNQYVYIKKRFYGKEKRWKDNTFWKRRISQGPLIAVE